VLGAVGVGPPRALQALTAGLNDAAPEIPGRAPQALGALRGERSGLIGSETKMPAADHLGGEIGTRTVTGS
jgi:hypothetical protein